MDEVVISGTRTRVGGGIGKVTGMRTEGEEIENAILTTGATAGSEGLRKTTSMELAEDKGLTTIKPLRPNVISIINVLYTP